MASVCETPVSLAGFNWPTTFTTSGSTTKLAVPLVIPARSLVTVTVTAKGPGLANWCELTTSNVPLGAWTIVPGTTAVPSP